MNKKEIFFKRHPAISLILFLMISIILIDLIAGMLFIPSDNNSYRCKNPFYHHGLKPNCQSSTTWNGTDYYSFFTNSLGFRDAYVREIPLSNDKRRILFIGDSHTEGVGVDYEKSFAGILQSRLDTSKAEILNAGVVGYSPKLYYLKVKYLIENMGLKFDELVVFIDISDIQNELVYKDFNPDLNQSDKGIWKNFSNYPSYIFYAIRTIAEERKRKEFYEKRGKSVENPKTDLYYTFFDEFKDDQLLQNEYFHTIGTWYLDKTIFDKWGREGLTLEKWYMLQLAELCTAHHIKMSVSVHPWPIQITAGDWNSIQVQFWKKFSSDNNLQFINFFSVIEKKAFQTNVIKKYYFSGDVHLNAEGHKMFADELMKYLE